MPQRTARMLRRTLLCAVFACPLSALSSTLGALMQLLGLVFVCLPTRQRALWAGVRYGFGYGFGRALFCACLSICACALLESSLLWILDMTSIAAALLRVLSRLTAILLQGTLILRIRKANRQHLAAGLLVLVFTMLLYRL